MEKKIILDQSEYENLMAAVQRSNEMEDRLKLMETRLRILEISEFGISGNFWHTTSFLEDGRMVGQLGALMYIIDPNTKLPMSRGYHSIEIEYPRHHYIGRKGAKAEQFSIRDC